MNRDLGERVFCRRTDKSIYRRAQFLYKYKFNSNIYYLLPMLLEKKAFLVTGCTLVENRQPYDHFDVQCTNGVCLFCVIFLCIYSGEDLHTKVTFPVFHYPLSKKVDFLRGQNLYKEIKKVRKKRKKTRSRPRKRSRKEESFLFFLDAFLVESVFSFFFSWLSSCFLVFFYKFPPLTKVYV